MRSILKWFLFTVILSTTLLATDAVASPADLLAAGRVDEVIASLQSQVNASPENAGAYNYLCRAYYALGDWDRAIANCEKSVKLASDNSDYHLWLGRAYGEKADHVNPFSAASLAGKLRREFERAVELSPNSVEARSDLAEFYIDAPGIVGGGLDKARLQAQALAGFAPAKAHYLNGRIAEKEKDAAVAEKEYRAAIDASQGHANDWLNLALFYRHGNKLDDMDASCQCPQGTKRSAGGSLGNPAAIGSQLTGGDPTGTALHCFKWPVRKVSIIQSPLCSRHSPGETRG
jgi:tetratricopeptide (TPR) repeat protein